MIASYCVVNVSVVTGVWSAVPLRYWGRTARIEFFVQVLLFKSCLCFNAYLGYVDIVYLCWLGNAYYLNCQFHYSVCITILISRGTTYVCTVIVLMCVC